MALGTKGSNSSVEKKRTASLPCCRLFQNVSTFFAPGNLPAMPTMAILNLSASMKFLALSLSGLASVAQHLNGIAPFVAPRISGWGMLLSACRQQIGLSGYSGKFKNGDDW